tara:strand:- start:112 stop:519 length:408 start_codon:yes stop_codon:yes gene_type:complete
MVEAENAQQIQAETEKFGGQLPPDLQAQFQEEMERQISLKATEFIEEMFVEEQQSMEGQGQDPLVGLKQQELQIKAQDVQRKAQNDAARIDIDMQKMQQTEDLTKEKIQSNEDIAQLRANVNLSKENAKNVNSDR